MTIPGGYTSGDILTAANMNLLGASKVAFASATVSQTAIGTGVTDLTSLSVTWTAVSGRSYLVRLYLPVLQQNTSTGTLTCTITDSSNNVEARTYVTLATSERSFISLETVLSGISGSVTYKGRLLTSSNNVDLDLSTNQVAYILAEDLGET